MVGRSIKCIRKAICELQDDVAGALADIVALNAKKEYITKTYNACYEFNFGGEVVNDYLLQCDLHEFDTDTLMLGAVVNTSYTYGNDAVLATDIVGPGDCCVGLEKIYESRRRLVMELILNPDGTLNNTVYDQIGYGAATAITAGNGNNDNGNDYQVTLNTAIPADASFEVTIIGPLNEDTTGGANNNNALSEQDFVKNGAILTYSLYAGDDGSGRDDARRRTHILRMYQNVEELVDVKSPCDTDCDNDLQDFTVARPTDTPNTGWNNQIGTTGNVFAGDICLEYTIGGATAGNSPQMIGLNSDIGLNASYLTIDYAMYLYQIGATAQLRVYENGSFRGTFGSRAVGDVIKIQRVGSVITYYNNNVLLYTSLVPSVADLGFDNSFYYVAGTRGTGVFELSNLSLCQI